jgi:hypothetical protein
VVRPCDAGLLPVSIGPETRFYACPNLSCPRPLVRAEVLEALVWQALLYRYPESRPHGRQQVLEQAFTRVSVGADLGEVRYQWRSRDDG